MARWENNWTSQELEQAYLDLSNAAVTLRALRRYALAEGVKSARNDVNDELNRRERELAEYNARQLALLHPGTYGETAAAPETAG